MRIIALVVILLSLPVFIALLNRFSNRRDWALTALGLMLFLGGTLQIDAAIVSWRLWPGIAKGIMLSPMDALSLALILTRPGVRNRVPYLGLMLLFLLPSTLSLFVSFNPTPTLFVIVQVLRVGLMFVAIAGEVHRPSALRSLIGGIAIGLMLQGIFVVQQKFLGAVQASGTMGHQNILGMMVELSLIPLLALVLEGDRRKLVYMGIIAGLIIVASGGSRATMAFATLGLTLIILLSLARRVTRRKGQVLTVAVLAAVVFVPLGFATLKDRFGEDPLTLESEQRPAFERAAKAMSRDHPFGVGANNYVTIANANGYSQRAGVSWAGNNLSAPVHNSYLLMRAEMGWFGAIVLVFVLIVPIFGGLRLAFSDRKSPMLAIGVATPTVFLVAALHCNYEYAWHMEPIQRIFFANLAVLSGCIVAYRRAKRIQRLSRTGEMPAAVA